MDCLCTSLQTSLAGVLKLDTRSCRQTSYVLFWSYVELIMHKINRESKILTTFTLFQGETFVYNFIHLLLAVRLIKL